jgi:hypothetical protein
MVIEQKRRKIVDTKNQKLKGLWFEIERRFYLLLPKRVTSFDLLLVISLATFVVSLACILSLIALSDYLASLETYSNEFFAVLQSITELCLVPIVVFGFFLTFFEIRRIIREADFRIEYKRDYQINSTGEILIPGMYVINIGTGMAKEIYIRIYENGDVELDPVLDGKEKYLWRNNEYSDENLKKVKKFIDYLYLSTDEFPASYPKYKVLTAPFKIKIINWEHRKFSRVPIKLDCEILSDNSSIIKDKIFIYGNYEDEATMKTTQA